MNNAYPSQSLALSFENSSGQLLNARLDRPCEIEPLTYAIMCHCFTCTKETLTTSRVSRGLAKQGIAVLSFDFTGLGKSQGQFSKTNFSSMVDDVICANKYLEVHFQSASLLLGHSMGGTAVLAAAREINSCHSVITLASPSLPQHVLHHFGEAMPLLESGQNAQIVVAGQHYPVEPQFIQDVRNYPFQDKMKGFSGRIFSISAAQDDIVEQSEATEILQYTSGEAKTLSISDADHLFSARESTQTLLDELINWLNL